MSSTVRSALDAIGLPHLFKIFTDDGMEDEAVSICLEDYYARDDLKKLFPGAGHFIRFKKVYETLILTQKSEKVEPRGSSTVTIMNTGITDLRTSPGKYNPPIHSKQSFSPSKSRTNGRPPLSGEETPLPLKTPTATRIKSHQVVQPAQIIDFIAKGKSNQQSKLVLQEAALQKILSRVGGRPVSLIFIAGPSRQGKSFILSYMIKYLRSVSNNENMADWMGSHGSQRNEPLEGGFVWRNGVKRETVGIYMWPEPFTLTSTDGQKFDVLLVDTQGVFDHYTEKKDWATIVGLSLLTSSSLIFNISKSLQEDSLESLKEFMDFGLMASNADSDDKKPFQSLMFLIRDWNNGSEYSFGADGGAQFLDYCLDQKHTENGEKIRDQIRQCFEHLDCFLMPDPGEKVKDIHYDGSVDGMSQSFSTHLQHFIEHLFHPGNLSIKKIADNPVTGNDLLIYFQKYVQIFNSDKLPSADAMNRAMVDICNQTVTNKCVALYETEFQKLRSSTNRNFLLQDELKSSHGAASGKALALFDASKTLGGPVETKKSKKHLSEALLNGLLQLFTHQNQEMKEASVQNEVTELKAALADAIQSEVKRSSHGQDNFVESNKLVEITQGCHTAAMSRLFHCLQIENLDSIPSYKQQIVTQITESILAMEKENQIRTLDAEAALQEAVNNLSESLNEALKKFTVNNFYIKQFDFEQFFEAASFKSRAALDAKWRQSSLFKQGSQLLEQNIKELHSRFLKSIETLSEKQVLECRQSLAKLVKTYQELLQADLLRQTRPFSQSHSNSLAQCSQTFKSHPSVQSLPSAEKSDLKQQLFMEIQSKCKEMAQQHLQQHAQNLLKKFKETLRTTTAVTEDALTNEMNTASRSLEATWSDIGSVTTLNEGTRQDFNLDLKTELQSHLAKLAQRFRADQLKLEITIKNNAKMSNNNYAQLLKGVSAAAANIVDFYQKSSRVMTAELKKFEAKCKTDFNVTPDTSLLQSVLSELRNELSASLAAELEVFDLTQKQAEAAAKQDQMERTLAEEKMRAEEERVRQDRMRQEDREKFERERKEREEAQRVEMERFRKQEEARSAAEKQKITQEYNAPIKQLRWNEEPWEQEEEEEWWRDDDEDERRRQDKEEQWWDDDEEERRRQDEEEQWWNDDEEERRRQDEEEQWWDDDEEERRRDEEEEERRRQDEEDQWWNDEEEERRRQDEEEERRRQDEEEQWWDDDDEERRRDEEEEERGRQNEEEKWWDDDDEELRRDEEEEERRRQEDEEDWKTQQMEDNDEEQRREGAEEERRREEDEGQHETDIQRLVKKRDVLEKLLEDANKQIQRKEEMLEKERQETSTPPLQ